MARFDFEVRSRNTQVAVRFSEEIMVELLAIADKENTTITQAVIALVRVGLEEYKKEG